MKKGDCEDQAIYLQYILYKRGVFLEVVFGKFRKQDPTYHAWVECRLGNARFILDPTNHVFSNRIFLTSEMYLRIDFSFYVMKKVIKHQNKNGFPLNMHYKLLKADTIPPFLHFLLHLSYQ